MKVPLADLPAQVRSIRAAIDAAIAGCLERGQFLPGEQVAAFEREFATWLGVPHVVGCGSGTDALYLALRAAGVGPGDEVVVPANTFIATAEAVSRAGARPVFADIVPATHTLCPADAARRLGPRTRALLPVHLFGNPADLAALRALAAAHGLLLLADAAQAHGARLGDQDVSGGAVATAYSFNPSKNLGACGNAGAVATADEDLARRAARLADHGRQTRHLHLEEGWNMRLDEIQAAVLRAKLPCLARWNARRRELAARYRTRLAALPIGWVEELPGARGVFHQQVVEVEEREALAAFLAAGGVATNVHYPLPLPLQPAYAHLGLGPTDFPVAVAKAARILSLPLFPEMSDAQHEHVCVLLDRWYEAPRGR